MDLVNSKIDNIIRNQYYLFNILPIPDELIKEKILYINKLTIYKMKHFYLLHHFASLICNPPRHLHS